MGCRSQSFAYCDAGCVRRISGGFEFRLASVLWSTRRTPETDSNKQSGTSTEEERVLPLVGFTGPSLKTQCYLTHDHQTCKVGVAKAGEADDHTGGDRCMIPPVG